MTRSSAQLITHLKSGFALLCGALLFSVAAVSWVNTEGLLAQLFPADVAESVVAKLGGVTEYGGVNNAVHSVGVVSVWLRLAIGLVMLAGCSTLLARACKTSVNQSRITDACWKSAVLLTVSSTWWLMWVAGELIVPGLQDLCAGLLPMWVTGTLGILCWFWWPMSAAADEAPALTHTTSTLPVLCLTVCTLAWIAVSFWMNKCLYDQVLIPHGDSAMYEEHLWNVWHGKGFRSDLDQGLFLGEHIQVIHLLLLPLHMLWPSHLLLELAESIALGSCTIPIYLMARRHTGRPWAAALLAIAWLFYYPVHFLDIAIDQKTFRPIALGLPFLFWMIEFAERGKLVSTVVCLILALSAKEDMALVACPILAVLAIRSRQQNQEVQANTSTENPDSTWRWLVWLSGLSAVYLVIAVLVVIPAFRSGDHVHYSRYFGDLGATPGELMHTAFTKPSKIAERFFSGRTLLYICVFLGPVAFLPRRRPLILSAGLLTFGMLSLLQLGEETNLPPVPYHHFHAPLLVVVLWATSVAAGTSKRSNAASQAGLVLCCCVSTAITGSLMPCGVSFWSTTSPFGYERLYLPSNPQQQERAAMAQRVVDQIPQEAKVASTDFIHTRLTHCQRSYDYSDYLRAVNNYRSGVPADTDYIVIDTRHRYSKVKTPADVRELQEAPDDWELLPDTTNGAYLILKRRSSQQ